MPIGVGRRHHLDSWFDQWRKPLIHFLLRRVKPKADIEDITQEVFLRLLRFPGIESVTHPRAYLFTMAANVANDWAAKASRRQPHSRDNLEDLEDPTDLEAEFDREARDNQLRLAYQHLAPRTLEILRLHFGEGLTYDDIAHRLRLTQRIVKRELIGAYVVLRERLGPDFAPMARPARNRVRTDMDRG